MAEQKREFDVIVFGATGYTGQYTVEKLAVVAAREKLTWAIAGRNKTKLEKCLVDAEKMVGSKVPDNKLKDVPIVICDVDNEGSVNDMCRRTQVLLNCVGPYALYGEPIVRACVANGTSHLDVSGEPAFLEQMVIKFDQEAQKRGVYVIGACGFDSVPIEAALQYTEEQFAPGEVNDVEAYLKPVSPAGYKVHYGTLHSLVHSLVNWGDLATARKQLAAYENITLPKSPFPLKKRGIVHQRAELRGWAIPFLGSDRSIVYRTQRTLYRTSQHRPVQLTPYVRSGSIVKTITLLLGMAMIFIFSKFPPTRWLILQYPTLFTFGFFSKEGATREQVAQATFTYTLFARGWRSKNANEVQAAPNKLLRVDLHGHDAGYVTTAVCLVEAAVSVIKERDRMLTRGGVLTVGAALRNTNYLKRLQSAEGGFRFEVKEL